MSASHPFTVESLPEGVAAGPLMPLRSALLDFVGEYLLDFEQAAGAEGLTLAQARVLGFAVLGLSMKEIAHQFGCDPSNITGKIDRLVALGLVERKADPKDARVKRVVATPQGTRTAVRLCDQRTWLKDALGQLDEDEVKAVRHAFDLLRRTPKSAREQ
jgi:DNA-binding MarR family transcriptional regulator